MGLFDKLFKRASAPVTVEKAAPKLVQDAWTNTLSGINTDRDRRTLSEFLRADRMTPQEGEDLWRMSDMAARIVETLPYEMLSEGYDVLVESDEDADEASSDGKEAQEAAESAMKELGLNEHLREAMCVARAMGGAAILLGLDDSQDPQMPLNEEAINKLEFLTVLNPREIWPIEWYADVRNPKFGMPAVYVVQKHSTGGGVVSPAFYVHESRIIRFEGVKTSKRQQAENRSWGDPVLLRCKEVLSDFDMGWGAAASLLSDFAQGVFKIAGLAEAIASNQGQLVKERLQAMDFARSVLRSVAIDSTEDFERKATPLSGYPEMMDRFCNRLAASADLPVSLLMGQAPAGLNATGDAELRWFFKKVTAEQKRIALPALRRLIHLIFISKEGPTNGQEPENWSVKFRPLWSLSEAEMADVRFKMAQADQLYIQNQVLMPEEVAQSRFGGDEYSMHTQLDADLRQGMLDAYEMESMPADELVPNQAKGSAELNAMQQMQAMKQEVQNTQNTSSEGNDVKPKSSK